MTYNNKKAAPNTGRGGRASGDKDVNAMVRKLILEGWTVKRGGKHAKLQAPNGNIMSIPGSPGDRRALQNFAADVKRARGEEK